jgi:magnesium transporter
VQRLFHKLTEDGPLVACPAEQLDERRHQGGWIWLDVEAASPGEVTEIGRAFGFDRIALEDVLEERQFPKVDDYGDYLLIVLHGLAEAGQRLDTSELDAFVGKDFLVTFRDAHLPGLEWVVENAQRNPIFAEGGPDRMIARLAEAGGRRYLPLLDSLEERIEELEEGAIQADPHVIPAVQALRRDVILLRRVLGPQRELLLNLSREGVSLIGGPARRRFADSYDHHYRLVESLDAARSLLGSVLETYRGSVAERLNEVLKVLTVFTAILLPLSLIAGIYGMNFQFIPELRWRWAYFAVLGLMALVAIGLWLYFVQRDFIGGPKLRKLPRAVGLGLMSLATAPMRTVGWLLFEEAKEEEAKKKEAGTGRG